MPHDEWLEVAERDLEAAMILAASPKLLLDIALYHTQQCAEKALKAFLVWKGQEIEKTHFLPGLIKTCQQFEPEFDQIMDDGIFLNPFSTLYRYPDGDAMPSEGEVEQAIQAAQRIFGFVRRYIV